MAVVSAHKSSHVEANATVIPNITKAKARRGSTIKKHHQYVGSCTILPRAIGIEVSSSYTSTIKNFIEVDGERYLMQSVVVVVIDVLL